MNVIYNLSKDTIKTSIKFLQFQNDTYLTQKRWLYALWRKFFVGAAD